MVPSIWCPAICAGNSCSFTNISTCIDTPLVDG